MSMNAIHKNIFTIFFVSLLSIACVFIYFITPLKEFITAENIRELKAWIQSYGSIAPLLFIVLYIAATILCFPATIITFLGGVIFNLSVGTIVVVIASNLGTMITFWIARALGREFVEKYLTGSVEKIDAQVHRHGAWMVTWIRLMPFLPYNLMNYAFGLTNIRFRHWVIGNFVGMLPWAVGLVSLGTVTSKISLSDWSVWTSPEVWGPILFMAGLLFFPTIVHIYRSRRKAV